MTNHKIKFQKCIKINIDKFTNLFEENHYRNQLASHIRKFYSFLLLKSEYDS